jgi:hypothetical protein
VVVTAKQIRGATQSKLTTPVLALNGQFGHLLGEEQPEAVARAILAFCRECGVSGG